MYYGYEADQNYVLCSASNCTHDSADCSAYVGDCYDIYGFSCYDGKLYYLRHQSYDSDKMEMISMDVDGTNKKVIAELDIGDYSAGSWKLDSVMPVYYSNGYAIMYLNHTFIAEDGSRTSSEGGYQIIMLDLSDGSIQEVTDILRYNIDVSGLYIDKVTEKYLIYEVFNMDNPYLKKQEFYDAYGENASYDDYLEDYYDTTKEYQTDWCVDLETGEQVEIITAEVEDRESTYLYCGSYDDKVIAWKPGWTKTKPKQPLTLYLFDPNTKEFSEALQFTERINDLRRMKESSIEGMLYEDGLQQLEYETENEYHLYLYSFADGTLKEIRNQTVEDDFYVWGVTDDLVIGGSVEDSRNLSWLTKEDYEEGNFENVTKISLEW